MASVDSITGIGDVSQATTADKTLKDKVKSYHVNDASSLKEDTLSLQNKVSKNKKGLIIGAAAALGIAAGVIYGVKTGKLQGLIANIKGDKIKTEVEQAGEETVTDATSIIEREVNGILEESVNVIEESKGILNEAKNTIDEVENLFEKGKKEGFKEVKDKSGNVIRRFEDGVRYRSEKEMKEFDNSGVIKRSATFNESRGNLEIKEFIDSTGKRYNRINVYNGGKTIFVGKEAETLDCNNWKAGRAFTFEDDKLSFYQENLEEDLANGRIKRGRAFTFADDTLSKYRKNCEKEYRYADWKVEQTFEFDDSGKIIDYTKDVSK